MSGRRRRGDGWDEGHLSAEDERRDPWADSSVDEWADRDRDPGNDAGWSGAPSGGGSRSGYQDGNGTGGYPSRGRGASSYTSHNSGGYAAPSFPSFQAPPGGGREQAGGGQSGGHESARRGGDRQGSGYGVQRGASGDHAQAGYNGDRDRDPGYGRNGQGGSRRDAAGYDTPTIGRPGSPAHAPEFRPADNHDNDDDGPLGIPRPYGRLSIYTLQEDKTREFDRLAERAAEGVRTSEPDTLVYVIHVVPKAPLQRIIYEIYRDRAAFLSHERQPHIRQFAADRTPCVLATNIIDLRLKYAKVAALGSPPESAPPQQPGWTPRVPDAAAGSNGYQTQVAQYQAAQHQPAQYPAAQSQQPATVATFTPAKDRYGADNGQHAAAGRDQYASAAQYDNSGNGAYGAGNGQYGAANGYPAAAAYANGGSYPSASGYPGSHGYAAGNGYPSASDYSGGDRYPNANGYADANGYSNGSSYSGAGGYSTGNGYSGANGYQNGNGYSGAAGYPNGSYGPAGAYSGNGGEAYGARYTPQYRELTSGGAADAGGYPDNDGRSGDATRPSARPQPPEWPPRPQDQR